MKLLGLLFLLLTACTVQPIKPPEVPPIEMVKPAPIDSRQMIFELVTKHTGCSKYFWKDRSVAKVGYMRGMAIAYHRAVCSKEESPALGNKFDALVLYKKPPTLLSTYTLLIGLGMRESDGKYCVGMDSTNASSNTADTCEAGAFQMSYNLRFEPDGDTLNSTRKSIYASWKAEQSDCELALWKEGVGECSSKNYGTGEGLTFQKLNKSCPAFSAQYAAAGLRRRVTHWGPAKRKEAEYRQACEDMLAEVGKVSCQ